MPSKIIGKISFDDALLQKEFDTIATFPHLEEAYPEFGVGSWRNHSLWNKSGDYHNMQVEECPDEAKITELGNQLPYLNQIIRETFDITHLKMVRSRNLVNGFVFPHRDFVELSKNYHYLRVFIPLKNNENAYHSDEYSVFQMQKGEIWQLDASIVHAAANFGHDTRVHICLDFQFSGDRPPLESIFLNPQTMKNLPQPTAPERLNVNNIQFKMKQFTKNFSRETLYETLIELSKVHFQYDVHIADCYDWLVHMAVETGDNDLITTCKQLKHFMIVKRNFGEQFSFQKEAA